VCRVQATLRPLQVHQELRQARQERKRAHSSHSESLTLRRLHTVALPRMPLKSKVAITQPND
jgi:hypothetical protein